MSFIRMTTPMKRSLERRLEHLDKRIEILEAQQEDDDSFEATALLEQLRQEHSGVADTLRDAILIDGDPFDTEAIEIGDTVTVQDPEGAVNRYVLVDNNIRTRAQSDWVSMSSPLGAALLGRGKGDDVHIESPSGTMSYVVVDFERASDGAVGVGVSGGRVPAHWRSQLPSEAFIG